MPALKKFVEDNKAAVLIGAVSVAALGLIWLFKSGADEEDEQPQPQQKVIDPTVKNVSLFDRLGGDFTVDFLVQSFVDKLHANKKLKPLLQGKSFKAHLKQITLHAKHAFGQQFDLPLVDYEAVLGGYNLTDEDFNEVIAVTEATLQETAVDTREINDAKKIVEQFRKFAVKPQN